MEEAVTDVNDYAHQRQLVLVDVVNPLPHSLSSSSSIAPPSPNSSSFSPNDGSSVQKVSSSDVIHSSTATPTKMITTSQFTLPKHWSVQTVYRKFGGTADKYYRDPETGIQFRSLKEVERYITEGITPRRSILKNPINHNKKVSHKKVTSKGNFKVFTKVKKKKSGSKDIIVADKKAPSSTKKVLDVKKEKDDGYQLANVGPTSGSVSPFHLPDGWVVKEVPRVSGGYADKYYFEPGTGLMFRSLVAVEKHLEENSPLSVKLEEIKENNLPISKAFKLSATIKNYGSYSSWKKSLISRKQKTCPPSKVNWVIAGSGGDDTWNAFMNDTLVQESVKKQWGDTFLVAITNGKHINTPLSG
ncbi:hypothetical protein LXL04_036462 [Taraxacum kok-saghyz]